MEAAFAWLGELVNWVGRWIPRLGICRATHGGVRFRHGAHTVPVRPGLYCYWPLVTEVEVIPTARQSINLPAQSLTTRDKATVVVSATLIYEVRDVVKALGRSWDVEETVRELGCTAAVRAVTSRTFEELRKELTDEVRQEMTAKSRALLRRFGVYVIEARFSEFAECEVFRHIGTPEPVVRPPPEEA